MLRKTSFFLLLREGQIEVMASWKCDICTRVSPLIVNIMKRSRFETSIEHGKEVSVLLHDINKRSLYLGKGK